MDLGFLRFDLMCWCFISFRSVVVFCFFLGFHVFVLDVDFIFVLLVIALLVLDFDSEMVDY